jgi:hypothetical protein
MNRIQSFPRQLYYRSKPRTRQVRFLQFKLFLTFQVLNGLGPGNIKGQRHNPLRRETKNNVRWLELSFRLFRLLIGLIGFSISLSCLCDVSEVVLVCPIQLDQFAKAGQAEHLLVNCQWWLVSLYFSSVLCRQTVTDACLSHVRAISLMCFRLVRLEGLFVNRNRCTRIVIYNTRQDARLLRQKYEVRLILWLRRRWFSFVCVLCRELGIYLQADCFLKQLLWWCDCVFGLLDLAVFLVELFV